MADGKRAAYAKVLAKALSDDAFKQRLLSDSHTALSELDIQVPEGMTVNVVANTSDTVNLVLPAIDLEGDLSEDELNSISGGTWGVW